MFILGDDKGAQDVADLCKERLSVHMYVQHPLSQLTIMMVLYRKKPQT